MAQSVREQCLAALAARLGGVSVAEIPELEFDRNRSGDLGDRWHHLLQEDLDSETETVSEEGEAIREACEVQIRGFVEADAPADLAPRIDALYIATVQAIQADPRLGELAIDTTIGSFAPQLERESKTPKASFTLTARIEWQRADGDVTQVF